MSDSSKSTTTATTAPQHDVIPAFLDPLVWHPQCSNFEIIDWEKFESLNPRIPTVYEPPQLKWKGWNFRRYRLNFWSGRSNFFNFFYPFSIANILHLFFTSNNPIGRPKTGYVSKDDIFVDLLRPEVASEAVPEILKGAFWMRDNVVPESLLTFQHMAWKSNAVNAGQRDKLENPNGDGVIGVMSLGYNWTNDGTLAGAAFRRLGGGNVKATVQMSPSGKWIAMAFGRDFSAEGKVNWCLMYVIQEEDEMEIPDGDEDGPDRHKVKLRPGDLLRIDLDVSNIYNVNSAVRYMYLVRKVASWDAKENSLVKHQPDFDDYRHRATSSDVYKGTRPTWFGLWAGGMTPEERAEFVRKEVSNRQFYIPAPPPPTPQQLDRLVEQAKPANGGEASQVKGMHTERHAVRTRAPSVMTIGFTLVLTIGFMLLVAMFHMWPTVEAMDWDTRLFSGYTFAGCFSMALAIQYLVLLTPHRNKSVSVKSTPTS